MYWVLELAVFCGPPHTCVNSRFNLLWQSSRRAAMFSSIAVELQTHDKRVLTHPHVDTRVVKLVQEGKLSTGRG